MVITTRKLGLAAFIKMKGTKLIDVKDRIYSFESEIKESDWEVQYLNSCCYRHDTELVNLRKLLR